MSLSAATAPLRVERYSPAHAAAWNQLIAASGNGPFLLARTFLDYHADRFEDYSWLVWAGAELQAVFVAGRARNTPAPATLVAHPGLAYGGLVHAGLMKYQELAAIMELLRVAWRAAGFQQLVVRPVPRGFCRLPADGLAFWLHQQGARLTARELNSIIDLTQPFRIGSWRQGNLRKARRAAVQVAGSPDYAAFWLILTENLRRAHGRQPVHSLSEIEQLRDQNPGHLSLYMAGRGEEMLAGAVVFQDARQGFVHTQYIAGSPVGKQVGAVDAVLMHIVEESRAAGFQRLSFGISTVQGVVNEGLLNQKEGFGAAAEAHDTYTLDL